MKILTKTDVSKLISMKEAILCMEEAFIQFHRHQAILPHRTIFNCDSYGSTMMMPGQIKESHAIGLKIVSVRPHNSKNTIIPSIPATIMIINEETGIVDSLMEASLLTGIRTAAGSAVATKYLAKNEARIVACFGAGLQARYHIEAMITVRPSILKVLIINRTLEKSKSIADELTAIFKNVTFIPIMSPHNTSGKFEEISTYLKDCDIILTTTNSKTPLFDGRSIPNGCHLNCIGSYTPEMTEIDTETIIRSRVVVDDKDSCLLEAGDLIRPLKEGHITESHILCSLGQLCDENLQIRRSNEDITLFKSVGLSIQDIAIGKLISDKAKEEAYDKVIGTTIDLLN